MSLADVSRLSSGRWSSSMLGYYERGDRIMSAPTLHDLASFYGITVSYLLGEGDAVGRTRDTGDLWEIVLHLPTVRQDPRASPIAHLAQRIAAARGDDADEWLSIRSSDLRAVAAALGSAPSAAIAALRGWGCRVTEPAG